MKEATRWWWIRHAPVVDHGGRIYGQTDLVADCCDVETFSRLAEWLPEKAVWITSHLKRTQQTAAAIRAHMRCDPGEVVVEPLIERGFAEQHFGDWQGLTHDELARRRDGAWHRFWLAPACEAPPGGESFVQLCERAGTAISRLTAEHEDRDLVVVAHGGSIRAAIAYAVGLDPERALAFAIDNCSLTRLDHFGAGADSATPSEHGAWRLAFVNRSPKAFR